MAKQPTTRHRFRIIAETDAESVGPLLAQLTIMGLENVGYELITDVRSYSRKHQHETSHEDFLMEWIKEHPTFKAIDAAKHFEDNGRDGKAIHGAISRLAHKEVIKKLGAGNYSAANVKHIEGPKTRTRPANAVKQYEVKNRDFILKYIRNKKRFTNADLTAAFVAAGRVPKSISPLLLDLKNDKFIKAVGIGSYETLAKAKAKPAKAKPAKTAKKSTPKKKDAAPKLNGSAAIATETANG